MSKSFISNKEIKNGEEVFGYEIRDVIYDFIKKDYPDFTEDKCISIIELNNFRKNYLSYLIEKERGELEEIDKDVMNAINSNSILSENIEEDLDEHVTFGEKIADKVAAFGGSWTFIITFFLFIMCWMILNVWIFKNKSFDPYPFILLNLILSCLAALQAPIIMMSQNRQEQKDRMRAENDYKVNLKAELEIKLLSEKIDHLLVHQNKKLLQIQEIQTDYLEDLTKDIKEIKTKE